PPREWPRPPGTTVRPRKPGACPRVAGPARRPPRTPARHTDRDWCVRARRPFPTSFGACQALTVRRREAARTVRSGSEPGGRPGPPGGFWTRGGGKRRPVADVAAPPPTPDGRNAVDPRRPDPDGVRRVARPQPAAGPRWVRP